MTSMETHLPLREDPDGSIRNDLLRIAASLCGWGVENVVITLGGRGSVVVEQSGLHHVPCVTMDHVADPTAAGDSFVGALAVGVTAGLPREQALKLATYTAALTVSRMGAMPSLPTLDEVLALMAERGCQDVDLSRLDVLR